MKNKDCYNVSDWQDGFPPCNGVWEIQVPEHEAYSYYARFKDGLWADGHYLPSQVKKEAGFNPYSPNNNPNNPRKWRGVIDDE